jgi:hypothetical protein
MCSLSLFKLESKEFLSLTITSHPVHTYLFETLKVLHQCMVVCGEQCSTSDFPN